MLRFYLTSSILNDLYFSFLFKKFFKVYFWLCWVFLAAQVSLIAASGGYSVDAVHGLLAAVTSVVEHKL